MDTNTLTQMLVDMIHTYPWFGAVAAVAVAVSALATILPKPKEGSKFAFIYSIISVLAINIAKTKKEDDEKALAETKKVEEEAVISEEESVEQAETSEEEGTK